MRKRTFIFEGTVDEARKIASILDHYSKVAFPVGGSDCAAASREALELLVAEFQNSDSVEFNRRQRPMIRAAVKWFYTDSEYVNQDDLMFSKLLDLLE